MNKEIIEKVLLEISTPTGLTYSGDTTICNDEVKDIMNYINSLEQQCKKQKEVIDKVNEVIDKMINIGYSSDSTQYCATGEGSEFGTRAKIIKDMLKEVSE